MSSKSQHSPSEFKLWTVEDAHKAFFPMVKAREFVDAVQEHGTYRAIGKSLLMTWDDIQTLIAAVSARAATPIDPPPETPGLMVVISEPVQTAESLMFVGFAPLGKELALLDRVRLGYPFKLQVLCTIGTSYGDVVAFREKHKAHRSHGAWYVAAPPITDELRRLIEAEERRICGE